jgi:hypothetical protein
MPRHTEWIQHIPHALSELHTLPCPTIDRRTVQLLFHVSPRQAVRILSALGCYTAGKSLLIERRDLIAKLECLSTSAAVRQEQTRHQRVSRHLEHYRRDQHARQKRIPVQPQALPRCIASLPSDVSLQRGNLHIRFASAEDLLAKLFSLAQAISSDYAAFEQAIL